MEKDLNRGIKNKLPIEFQGIKTISNTHKNRLYFVPVNFYKSNKVLPLNFYKFISRSTDLNDK